MKKLCLPRPLLRGIKVPKFLEILCQSTVLCGERTAWQDKLLQELLLLAEMREISKLVYLQPKEISIIWETTLYFLPIGPVLSKYQ